MTILDWGKQLFNASRETANIVTLTILGVAWYVTKDDTLLMIGLSAEGLYLLLTPFSKLYRKRLESRAKDGKHVKFIDQVLLAVTVAGVLVISFFGFGKHLLNHRWYDFSHAQGWEAGAIIWTGLFLVYYVVKFRFTKEPAADKVIIVAATWGCWQLLRWAWDSMRAEKPIEHVFYVWLIGACFFLIDLVMWWRHTDRKEKNLSRTSLIWADSPMVIAFLVLIAYLKLHPDTEDPKVFVAGVISCQLLISNVLFVVMEFGLLRARGAPRSGAWFPFFKAGSRNLPAL
ncbi:MAG TPA: hypothetical protein VN920_15655 [Pyrinomonadaceae bacterium]|nr:hypothetical protein [Pyrinomonadaceae bacterium]